MTAFSGFGSMVACVCALLVGFVGAQLVCVARQNLKALLRVFFSPTALSLWFALIVLMGGAFFAGSPEYAPLFLVISGLLGIWIGFLST